MTENDYSGGEIPAHAVLSQIAVAGYLQHLRDIQIDGPNKISAYADPVLISKLRGDVNRFGKSPWHFLHTRVPKPRIEFRAYRGCLGDECPGSLQMVISKNNGFMEADIDTDGPYDVWGMVVHLSKDVVWPTVKGWFS